MNFFSIHVLNSCSEFFHADLTQHHGKIGDVKMGPILGIMLQTVGVVSPRGCLMLIYLSNFEAGVQKTSHLFAGRLNSQSFFSLAGVEFSFESNAHETHIYYRFLAISCKSRSSRSAMHSDLDFRIVSKKLAF